MELFLLKLLENSNNKEIVEAVNQQADMIAANREAITGLAKVSEVLHYGCLVLLVLWTALVIYVIISNHKFNERLKKLEI